MFKDKSVVVISPNGSLHPEASTFASAYRFAKLCAYLYIDPEAYNPRLSQLITEAVAMTHLPYLFNRYYRHVLPLIQKLNVGKLTEHDFLETLLHQEFPFLDRVLFSTGLRRRLKLSASCSDKEVAIALLKQAWLEPRMLPLSQDHINRWKILFEKFDGIILLVNSNSLDMKALLRMLGTSDIDPEFSALFENPEAFAKKMEARAGGLLPLTRDNVLKNTYLMSSHITGHQKYHPKNPEDSMLYGIMKELTPEKTQFISGWPNDLPHMRAILGIAPNDSSDLRVQSAQGFFNIPQRSSPLLRTLIVCIFIMALLLLYYHFF